MPVFKVNKRRRASSHLIEVKVAKIQAQIQSITTEWKRSSVPSNRHLFEKTRTQYEGKPIGEMGLNMQLMNRVKTNEKAITKCMSMIEDMTKEMQEVRDEHLGQIKETEMSKKLDQDVLALDGLNVSSDIVEQLQELKEQVDALAAAREQMSESLELLTSPPSPQAVTSNVDLLLQQEKESHTLAIASLQMKVFILENRLNLIQDMINQDSTRWEIKQGTVCEEDIRDIFIRDKPDKTRNLAYVVNDQLHDIRDGIITLGEKLDLANGHNKQDHDALLESQNANRDEFKQLLDELQVQKADRSEVDLKADKKVDQSLFDTTTNDIGKFMNDILDQIKENEEDLDQQYKVFRDDIEWLQGGLKVLDNELKKENQAPVELIDDDGDQKEWLQSKLEVLNDELKKQNQAPVELIDEAAAGIDQKEWLQSRLEVLDDELKKQNQSPVELIDEAAAGIRSLVPSMPFVSSHHTLLPARSPSSHLTFKMKKSRQHAKSDTIMYTSSRRSRKKIDCTVTEKQKASQSNSKFDGTLTEIPNVITSKFDQEAFQIHFGNNVEAFQKGFLIQRMDRNNNADRSCGGQHTTTYPQLWTTLPRISNSIITVDEEPNV